MLFRSICLGGAPLQRLLALLGGSTALGEHLIRHPGHVLEVAAGESVQPEQIVSAVEGLSGRVGADALRVAYRRQLVRVATADLTSPDPVLVVDEVAAHLADLAAAGLQAALLLARAETSGEDTCDFTIIGMGKTGGRELNYLSDVDVIFLAAPRPGSEERAALKVGNQIATAVMRICGQATAEGMLWQVDAALRPEGRNGPLVRSLDSHREYYHRWAKTWEFQALLKARPLAGDESLGQSWLEIIEPLVWEAAGTQDFVADVQAMRRRVEEHIRPQEADRQLKLGPGGLRDIEFSVQLLQLVHGRTDDLLRSPSTLAALAALRDGGYVGRDDAALLDHAYRFLRCLEHRLQLNRLHRTHVMPTAPEDLRRLGRAMGERGEAERAITQRWRSVQRDVRRLHERLFYRPLLSAVARLSTDEATLSPDAARARLAALGFSDPAGAMRHLESLTDGVSRRATIQRHLLPVMLSWFADGADPDAGLLAFRRISDTLGTTHWYLGMLRDEGWAAQRLALVLSCSRYAVDLLLRSPESVSLLGDKDALAPLPASEVRTRMSNAAGRHDDADAAFQALRSVRARELIRIVLADVTEHTDPAVVREALSDVTDAYLQVALQVATRVVLHQRGQESAVRVLIVGMGRLGGRELGYASDADVLYVYDPAPGSEPDLAASQANEIISALRRGLSGAGPDPAVELDADLRPEGRSGPLVRSLESYAAYYRRWSAGWESQALLRARPIAGDEDLGKAFRDVIEPLRWPQGGIDTDAVRTIRTLKARMEAERLPRGADPRTHLKLGLGGLTDVEWVAQLLQLQHAHAHPTLRTTSTGPALLGAVQADVLGADDAAILVRAWDLASQLRDAGILWLGRAVESVPSAFRDAEGMARVMGRAPGSGSELAQEWRAAARRARAVVERLFYGDAPPRPGSRAEPAIRPRLGSQRPGRAAGFRRAAVNPPRSAARFTPPRGPFESPPEPGRQEEQWRGNAPGAPELGPPPRGPREPDEPAP